MKKFLVAVLILVVFSMPAMAEVDLSEMSYEELVKLKDQINLAIWQCNEWQEVEVPAGIWIVGEDIPAGKWTIKHTDGVNCTKVVWADAMDASGADLTRDGKLYEYEYLYDPDDKFYYKGNPTEVTWNLKDGQYLMVETGIATFTPYAGKPSLGFK